MKKILIIASLVLMGVFGSKNINSTEVIIPKEAIRFRVVAASNSKEDQENKIKVRDALQKDITSLLEDSDDVSTTRNLLKNNVNRFEGVVSRTLLENQVDDLFEVHYGLNYFPEKQYRGVTYEEGYYESLVVTLGAGNGENWWCVLFPPLCLLEAEETNTSEVEYKSFVQELITKYFG